MRTDPAALLDRRARLSQLVGKLCPLCKKRGQVRPLLYDGRSLYCQALASHGWSNPDVAEAEILEDAPRSAGEMRRANAERVLQESARCGQLLVALEEAIGPWLPPEARQDC